MAGVLLAQHALTVDVNELVRRSVAATERNFRQSDNYAFVERDVTEKLDSGGAVKSRTARRYAVSMIDGAPYRRLMAVNGKPLTREAGRREMVKMEAERNRRLAESKADRAKRIATYEREHNQELSMLREMADAFQYTLAGEEVVNGRPAYVLEAAPKPGYAPKTRDTKVLTSMRGKLWIDKADRQWVKVEAEVIRPVSFYMIASVGPGTKFLLEQSPVGGGVWQPAHFAARVDSSVLWVSRNSNRDERYTDYHRIEKQAAARR